jgi:hypothetical protein
MPAGDRTGPGGLGPMTGRGMGYCAGFPGPGFMSPGPGMGFGRGVGFGRGFGRGFGFGRGRGWRRGGFGGFLGYSYPPMMPYGYPFGACGTPFPYSYGYPPYMMGPAAGYPATSMTPTAQKK